MHGGRVEFFARAAVELRDAAVFMARDDVVAEVGPACYGGFGLFERNGEGFFVRLLGADVRSDVEGDDGAEVAHALFGHAEEPAAVFGELDALDGRGEVPGFEALAGAHVPQLDGVVGGARGEQRAGWVDGDGPEGALVAFVCAEALAVGAEPGADYVVFARREDEVAVGVVFYLGEGALLWVVLSVGMWFFLCLLFLLRMEWGLGEVRGGGSTYMARY